MKIVNIYNNTVDISISKGEFDFIRGLPFDVLTNADVSIYGLNKEEIIALGEEMYEQAELYNIEW